MKEDISKASPERQKKRIQLALPIRVTYWDDTQKPCLEIACTYDISEHGARVTGLRCVKEAGEVIAIERGKNKAFCRVVWVGSRIRRWRVKSDCSPWNRTGGCGKPN